MLLQWTHGTPTLYTTIPHHTPVMQPLAPPSPLPPTHSLFPPIGSLTSPAMNHSGINTGALSKSSHTSTLPWRWNRQRVPKRRILKIGRRGDTQKKLIYIVLLCLIHVQIIFLLGKFLSMGEMKEVGNRKCYITSFWYTVKLPFEVAMENNEIEWWTEKI